MSANQQQSLPVWVVKWKMPKNGRGRKHAAIFIPNAAFTNDHPLSSAKCEGTLYQVSGSPFGGFSLEIRRNWDSSALSDLESAFQLCSINQQHVWIPTSTDCLLDDTHRRSDADKFAHNVRPPGVTSRPWIAEEVMDCQDWLVSFVEHMVQRKVVGLEALQATKDVMDPKTALMPAPGGAPPIPRLPSVAVQTASRPITASTVQAPRPLSPQHQQQQQEHAQPFSRP